MHFSALEFSFELPGAANITAGTVNATQNQAEVTGASTAFTTAMAGRYIAIGDAPWQKISYVSDSTHLTLEASWNKDTVTSQSYKIWKRDYQMPPKAGKILRVKDTTNPDDEITIYDPSEFNDKYGFADDFGDPIACTQFGTSDFSDGFLAATVYASIVTTANSPIVDFASGAGIVTGIAQGDRLRVGNATTATAFYVDKVLSDSRLALKQNVAVSLSSVSATALSIDRLHVQFYNAINGTNVYRFDAYKRFLEMTSDTDFLEEGWYSAVQKGAVAKAMNYVRDPRADTQEGKYRGEILNLVRNQAKAKNRSPRLKPYIGIRYGSAYYPKDRDDGL